MAADIEKKLAEAGYRMLGTGNDAEKLILDILKTKNIRYLKAIPFLIYKYRPDIAMMRQNYRNISDDEILDAIIAMTARLFSEFNIPKILPEYAEGDIGKYDEAMKQFGLDYNEFKGEFESQLRKEPPRLFIEKQRIYAERDLQMHLSRLFTKKEKYIIGRLLEEKPISRTDYEYYSRKTKKKFGSIMGLQDFARAIYTKTPEYDEDLYHLKKRLEDWLKNQWKIEGFIEKFRLSDGKLIVDARDNKGEAGIYIWRLNKIHDKELLNLLNEYGEHDFR